MHPFRYAAIAAGGALGAATRWAVAVLMGPPSGFPWPVFLVNVLGCAVLGFVLAEEWTHPRSRLLLHDFGAIGYCGGLTTFSTFAAQVVDLVEDGRSTTAFAYAGVNLVCGAIALLAGAGLLRRIRALTLPLEEEP